MSQEMAHFLEEGQRRAAEEEGHPKDTGPHPTWPVSVSLFQGKPGILFAFLSKTWAQPLFALKIQCDSEFSLQNCEC